MLEQRSWNVSPNRAIWIPVDQADLGMLFRPFVFFAQENESAKLVSHCRILHVHFAHFDFRSRFWTCASLAALGCRSSLLFRQFSSDSLSSYSGHLSRPFHAQQKILCSLRRLVP